MEDALRILILSGTKGVRRRNSRARRWIWSDRGRRAKSLTPSACFKSWAAFVWSGPKWRGEDAIRDFAKYHDRELVGSERS